MAFGFELRNQGGGIALSSTAGFPQIIWQARFDYDFSGDVSIPEFDDTSAMFFVSPVALVVWTDYGAPYPYPSYTDRGGTGESHPFPYPPVSPSNSSERIAETFYIHTDSLPDISWNNTTKLMSISPRSLPYGWPGSDLPPDYLVTIVSTVKRINV